MKFSSTAVAALFCAAAISAASIAPIIAIADPTTDMTAAYCSPPTTLGNGPSFPIDGVILQNNLVYGGKCPGQQGDIWFDGARKSPALTSIVGLTFTIPDNKWVAGGARVHTAATTLTADANTTDYLYLSTNKDEGVWTKSTSATPPANTVLEYTLVTGASAITNETDPPYAAMKTLGAIQAADLTAFNQSGHSGYAAAFDANGKLIATPFPSPNICPSPGTNITVTGTYPCTINASTASGVSSIVAGQNITLTPPAGTGAVTVADTVTPGPQATPSPTASTGITISGAWPYTVGVSASMPNGTPAPTAGTGIAISGTWPYTIGVSAAMPTGTPKPTATGCGAWTGSWPYTDDTTGCASLTTANAFTNAQDVEYNSITNCGGTWGIVPAEFCVDGTSTAGIVIGPLATSGTANSQQLLLCRIVTGTVTCPGGLSLTSGGQLNILTSSVISTQNSSLTVGTGNLTAGAFLQGGTACSGTTPKTGATGMVACHITAASGAWSFTYGHTFTSTPICIVSDETTAGGAKATSVSTTVCSGTSGTSDVVDVWVLGNPS